MEEKLIDFIAWLSRFFIINKTHTISVDLMCGFIYTNIGTLIQFSDSGWLELPAAGANILKCCLELNIFINWINLTFFFVIIIYKGYLGLLVNFKIMQNVPVKERNLFSVSFSFYSNILVRLSVDFCSN